MIDPLTIDKIRDTAQIYDVVSEFVALRRRGQNYIGLCPFHADKTPSFYVSPSKNICKCFACGEGGDPIHFLMKHETMSYVDALRWLGRKYGIEIAEREMSREERAAQTLREGMLQVNEFAKRVWANDLTATDEGRNIGLTYFRERGFQDDILRRYGLGYALERRTDLGERALHQGLAKEYLLRTGLCYENDRSHDLICRFAGRVIFPYRSLSGKYVAFGGRILQRVDHAFKKYVNSPESEIYHKGDLLYGIFEAKGEMAKRDKAYIVEGYFDVLSMAQAGFPNVIASSGTALTSGQIRMVQRFTRNVTLMFDGDGPGIRAALKTIDLLLLEGMKVKLLFLPDGDDPDSFCRRHSPSDVQQYFASHETDIITFKLTALLREAGNDPTARAELMQNVVRSIALVQDPILSSIYVRQAAQMLEVNEGAVIQALSQQRRDNYVSELRRMEAEQRRLIAQQQMREKMELEGQTGLSATIATPIGSAEAGTATSIASPGTDISTPGTTPSGNASPSTSAVTPGTPSDHDALASATTGPSAGSEPSASATESTSTRGELTPSDMAPQPTGDNPVAADANSPETGAQPATVETAGDARSIAEREQEMADAAFAAQMGAAEVSAATRPATPVRADLLSDRYERNVVRYVVRAGGELFTLRWTDSNGQPQEQVWRVIDFIGYSLTDGNLELRHPLYRQMYEMAIQASDDVSRPFDSVRFFTTANDPDVRRTAIDMASDKYDALGIVEHHEDLSVLVPRSIWELQASRIQMELLALKNQLRQPGCDFMRIMQRMTQLDIARMEFDKKLGERIITG